MKEMWAEPRILVEEFAANEYVAACWGVGCNWDDANDYEISIGNAQEERDPWGHTTLTGQTHVEEHCGFSGNQVIYDDNNDGVADRMVEVGTDGLGNLDCTLYTDNAYQQTMDISNVTPDWFGRLLFWTTSARDGRTWHHQGNVTPTVPHHPNRS